MKRAIAYSVSVLAALLLSAGYGSAAPAKPDPTAQTSPSAKPALTKFQQRVLSMVELDLQMTKALPVTQANRDRQLPIYEKLVELTCMPKLPSTLQYSGNPQDEQCLKYLDALKELQSDNLVVVCAVHGVDSDLCKSAYEEQYVATFNHEENSIEVVDLSAKLSALESEKPLSELDDDLEKAQKRFEETKDAAHLKVIRELLDRALSLACSNTRIIVQHVQPDPDLKAVRISVRPAPSPDALTQLVHEFGSDQKKPEVKASPTPSRSPAAEDEHGAPFQVNHETAPKLPRVPVWRLRFLSSECMNFVKRALHFDPHHALGVCYQQGFSSPDCVAAQRIQRERAVQEADLERQKSQGSESSGKESRIGTF